MSWLLLFSALLPGNAPGAPALPPGLEKAFLALASSVKGASYSCSIDVVSYEDGNTPEKTQTQAVYASQGPWFSLDLKAWSSKRQLICSSLFSYDGETYAQHERMDRVLFVTKKVNLSKPVLMGSMGPLQPFEFILPYGEIQTFQAAGQEPVAPQVMLRAEDLDKALRLWLKHCTVVENPEQAPSTFILKSEGGPNVLTKAKSHYLVTVELKNGELLLKQVRNFNSADNSLLSTFDITEYSSPKINGQAFHFPSSVHLQYFGEKGKVIGDLNMKVTQIALNPELSQESFACDPAQPDIDTIRDLDAKVSVKIPH